MSTDDRGVSAPLGIALLLAMVLVGMLVTVAVGATALDDTREQMDTDRAEMAMTQFDSKTAMVALGSTSHQSVSLADGGDGAYRVDGDNGWMNVTVENTTSGDETTLLNRTLGAVTYERGDARLAYQGGGVWKSSGTGSTMVSPPEFHFRNATLTLPVVTVDGTHDLGRGVAVTKNGPTVTKYPNGSLDDSFRNPLRDGKVEVAVQSEYYEAWGRYFEQRTDGEVDYDHDAETATVTLTVPIDTTVDHAFTIMGNAGFGGGVDVSSYDSRTTPGAGSITDRDYQETATGDVFATGSATGYGSGTVNGDLYVSGDYDLSGAASVTGDIIATGDVYVGTDVDGDIVAGGDVIVDNGGVEICDGCDVRAEGDFTDHNGGNTYRGDIHVDGSIVADGGGSRLASTGSMTAGETVTVSNNDGGTIEEHAASADTSRLDVIGERERVMPSPERRVERAINTYEDDNDNDTAVFDSFDGGSNANDYLPAGRYYYSGDLTYSGNPSLTFDTTDGDVYLVVDGDFDASNVDVDVQGDNRVHVYVNGSADFSGNPSVTNDAGRGDQFWLYTAASSETTSVQASEFYGVIYAESEVDLGGGTMVYGGVVAGGAGITGGQEIYYDERLLTADVFTRTNAPSISYLHVSINRVNVTSP